MAESTSLDSSIPTNVKEVTDTLQDTVGGVWGTFIERLPFIIAGILVLVATAILVAIFTRVLSKILRRNESMRDSFRDLVGRLASIALWFVGMTIAAIVIFPGIDLAKALGGLGLLSVAIGLAFQDIFENLFAGILLLWRFPFEKGDFIECGEVQGKVVDVQIRMTLIRKPTGELIIVPNSFLFKNPVEVLTDKPLRRVHLTAGIGYGEDVESSIRVIQEAVKSCETASDRKPVEIYPSGFGSSSIDIDVAWWTESTPGEVRRSRGEVVTSIKGALDQADIEIPFPYRTLTFSEPLTIDRSE